MHVHVFPVVGIYHDENLSGLDLGSLLCWSGLVVALFLEIAVPIISSPALLSNLWCNALTGVLDSRELCIWSCDRWEAIQRISLRPPDNAAPTDPAGRPGYLLVRTDLSGRLIVASDVTRSVLYVLELEGAGGADSPVYCRGVHEFVLASVCLDLAVMRVLKSESGEKAFISVFVTSFLLTSWRFSSK